MKWYLFFLTQKQPKIYYNTGKLTPVKSTRKHKQNSKETNVWKTTKELSQKSVEQASTRPNGTSELPTKWRQSMKSPQQCVKEIKIENMRSTRRQNGSIVPVSCCHAPTNSIQPRENRKATTKISNRSAHRDKKENKQN